MFAPYDAAIARDTRSSHNKFEYIGNDWRMGNVNGRSRP
jgi:hypothetical protein